jgi:putative SOS response-associated peptidase YedK
MALAQNACVPWPAGARGPIFIRMCGRFDFHSDTTDVTAFLDSVGEVTAGAQHYNLAPTQTAMVGLPRGPDITLAPMQFGWSWSHRPGMVINARSETVQDKPLFRNAFAARRCLVLANGFYEWATEGKKKQPYYFTVADMPVLAFAGLYAGNPATQQSFIILTTDANATVAPLHHRMPVILPRQALRLWLQADTPPPLLHDLLKPYDASPMGCHAVSRAMNNARHDGADCIAAVA